MPPPQWGVLDLGSDNSGCARLGGSKVTPPLGVVEEKFDFGSYEQIHINNKHLL